MPVRLGSSHQVANERAHAKERDHTTTQQRACKTGQNAFRMETLATPAPAPGGWARGLEQEMATDRNLGTPTLLTAPAGFGMEARSRPTIH